MQGQGPAAADGRAQGTPHQLLTHLGPEQLGRQGVQGPAQSGLEAGHHPAANRLRAEGEIKGAAAGLAVGAAVGQGAAQQTLPRRRHGRQGSFKTREQRLPEPRHADQIVGPHPLQVGPQLFEGGVGLAATAGQQKIFGAALIGVPDRQHAHHPIAGLRSHGHTEMAQLMQQVGVAERHPLGLARGAGGVQDRRQPVRLGSGAGQGPSRLQGIGTALQEIGPWVAGQRRRLAAALPLQQHHKAQLVEQLPIEGQPLQQQCRLRHEGHGARVAQDVAQLLRGGGTAPHRIGRTGPHQPLITQQPTGTVFGEQGHHLAGAHAQGPKPCRHLLDALVQLPVGEGFGLCRVGRLQGDGIAMQPSQLRPDLLQPGERTPVVPLGQGPAVAAIGRPVNRGESHRRRGGGSTTLTTPEAPRRPEGRATAA